MYTHIYVYIYTDTHTYILYTTKKKLTEKESCARRSWCKCQHEDQTLSIWANKMGHLVGEPAILPPARISTPNVTHK